MRTVNKTMDRNVMTKGASVSNGSHTYVTAGVSGPPKFPPNRPNIACGNVDPDHKLLWPKMFDDRKLPGEGMLQDLSYTWKRANQAIRNVCAKNPDVDNLGQKTSDSIKMPPVKGDVVGSLSLNAKDVASQPSLSHPATPRRAPQTMDLANGNQIVFHFAKLPSDVTRITEPLTHFFQSLPWETMKDCTSTMLPFIGLVVMLPEETIDEACYAMDDVLDGITQSTKCAFGLTQTTKDKVKS